MSWRDSIQKEQVEQPSKGKSSWRDSIKVEPEEISQTESRLRGSAQGLTFNLADEITGGSEALLKALFGGDKLADLPKNARKYIDESGANYDAAEKANPGNYLAGEITGSIAPAFLTGGVSAIANLGKVGVQQGLKGLAIAGAKQGAASAFGASKADLLTGDMGDVGQAALDTAIGTGIGAGAGVVLPTVGKQLGKAIGATGEYIGEKIPDTFKKGLKAYQLAKKGVKVVGDEASEALTKDSLDLANEFIGKGRDQAAGGSSKVGQALKSVGKEVDFSGELKQIDKALNDSNLLPDDLFKINKRLSLFKDTIDTETTTPGLIKAEKTMEDLIRKANSKAKALNMDVNFSPIENVDGKFLQTTKTTRVGDELLDSTGVPQTGTGLSKGEDLMAKKIAKVNAEAEQLGKNISVSEPIFDEESNMLFSTITTTDAKGKVTTKSISQSIPKDEIVNIPSYADKNIADVMQVDIPMDETIKTSVASFKKMDLQDIKNVSKELGQVLNDKKLDDQTKILVTKLKEQAEDIIQSKLDVSNKALYAEGNLSRAKMYEAGDILPELSPKNKLVKNMDLDLYKKLQSSSKQEEVNRALGLLEEQDPIFNQKIADLPIRKELQSPLKGEGSIFGWFNPKAVAIRAGEAAGELSNSRIATKVVEPVADFTKRFVRMDDSALIGLSNKLKVSTNPAFQKWGNALEKATQDSTKRDRLLWAISQQPAFRQMIQEEEAEQEEQN